jgi:hypothetical protein
MKETERTYASFRRGKITVKPFENWNRTSNSQLSVEVSYFNMDLQQALPTPKISCGPAFYKCKVLTYNFNIYDCVSDQGYMFTWDETTANWSSDEIGSCILKFIVMLPKKCKHLVIYRDNYPRQNKNWNICALWLYLGRSNYFEYTEQRFMVAGHTHIPSDCGFVKIEKSSKNHTKAVYNLDGWRQIVLQCNQRKPFHVTVTKWEDFVTAQIDRYEKKKKIWDQTVKLIKHFILRSLINCLLWRNAIFQRN